MSIPAHVSRSWRAMDDVAADVRPTPWGAVVVEPRFPLIWDVNHARVDRWPRGSSVEELEAELLPAMWDVGAPVEHVVSLVPGSTTDLIASLSSRGHRLGWDLVMGAATTAVSGPPDVDVVELGDGPEAWSTVEASFELFGIEPAEAVRQLLELERDVLGPGGKRWFGVRDAGGRIASLGALLVLEGAGYVDGVATFPDARGRGYASAVVATIAHEAEASGARHAWLMADPDEPDVVRMYERLGFRGVGRVASTRGAMPPPQSTNL